jgi:hypothetical protein
VQKGGSRTNVHPHLCNLVLKKALRIYNQGLSLRSQLSQSEHDVSLVGKNGAADEVRWEGDGLGVSVVSDSESEVSESCSGINRIAPLSLKATR